MLVFTIRALLAVYDKIGRDMIRRGIVVLSFRYWLRARTGATAIEYTLIAAGISLAIAGAVYLFGDTLYSLFYSGLPEAIDG